ncbi:MAG: hypothetical protein ACR2PH_07455 [Desulfobulbia bacterium]
MKKIALLLCLFVLVQSSAIADKFRTPSSAGGFTLNTDIKDYSVSSHENYLKEVIFTDLGAFRKGFITYGTCNRPGEILRIKLKYQDRSYKFYELLLKSYRKSFGENPKFTGDAFGNVKSWKWSFTNDKDQRVTLVLQHNLKDSDESVGNMLKLGLPDLMNAERICFNEALSQNSDSDAPESETDWTKLIPQ